LNLTRLHLGSAHESQFQGLGITGKKTRGRELGFCRNRDGEDIGKAIIEGGFALACPHYSERYVPFEQSKARQRLQRARCYRGHVI